MHPTSVEKREALKQMMPRSTWGWIEDYYTKGDMYLSGKLEGQYKRDEKDWNVRKWLGTYTTKEVAEKTKDYEAQRISRDQAAQRTNLIKKTMDEMIEDGQLPKDFLNRAIELDMTPKEFRQGLKSELIGRLKTPDQRMIGKGRTFHQKRMAQLLQKLGD